MSAKKSNASTRNPRMLTTEEVVKRFIEKHGDKYLYHLVDYQGNHKKVTIVCPEHGEFSQSPANHRYGNGCPKCGNKSANKEQAYKKRYLTTEQVIKQFEEKHGQRYDYSLVAYIGNQIKVKINCKDHGVFEQTPDHHKKGRGCPKCANIERSNTLLNKNRKVQQPIPQYRTVKEHLIATGQLEA